MLPVKQKVCDFKDLTELSCKEFTLKNATLEKDAFLIYFKQHCCVYENRLSSHGGQLNLAKRAVF